ncbi:MAG: HlyD family efflux transporter periplasmic adaptor subunit [Rhodanobacteraceae bacterium]|nr:MAG: HlyD family efflux transporter periplasmic adaptor subunit [Rhodanobacteraceae bacterium]
MKRRLPLLILLAVVLVAVGVWKHLDRDPSQLEIIGIVDGNQVAVSSKITARIDSLKVDIGDHVQPGQLIAVLDQSELQASLSAAQAGTAQAEQSVAQGESQLQLLEASLPARIQQARAQVHQAMEQERQTEANLALVQADYQRVVPLAAQGILSKQDRDRVRAQRDAAQAGVAMANRQVAAAQAALADALAQQDQIRMQRQKLRQLEAGTRQAEADQRLAHARFDQTEITAPVGGVVALRVARQGEVVNPGNPIVTIYDLSDTWVQADIPETWADLVPLGEKVQVRLPSGARIPGTVYFKATEADFATQRDVSSAKRDIRTVALRVRVDNHDGRLARGMTAWVELPLVPHGGRS